MSEEPKYTWSGPYQGPGDLEHGYFIYSPERMLEPGEVCDLLADYESLKEQIRRTSYLKMAQHSTIERGDDG